MFNLSWWIFFDEVFKIFFFYSYFTRSRGNTSSVYCFGDPATMFDILVVDPPEGTTWTQWERSLENVGEEDVFVWEKHKKLEVGAYILSRWIFTSATGQAGKFYKYVFNLTITPYEDT